MVLNIGKVKELEQLLVLGFYRLWKFLPNRIGSYFRLNWLVWFFENYSLHMASMSFMYMPNGEKCLNFIYGRQP